MLISTLSDVSGSIPLVPNSHSPHRRVCGYKNIRIYSKAVSSSRMATLKVQTHGSKSSGIIISSNGCYKGSLSLRDPVFARIRMFSMLFKLEVSFAVINYVLFKFYANARCFYFNYINYSGLLISRCQNVAISLLRLHNYPKLPRL